MADRATQLTAAPKSPDVSLVAAKKPPPENLDLAVSRPSKPLPPKSITPMVDEKAKAIEEEKKKSTMQKVGTKVSVLMDFYFFIFWSICGR